MKNLITLTAIFLCATINAQIKTPVPSPISKVEQKIGLTDVSIVYSRPHRRNREIFGKLVPFDNMWRTGANKNTIITTSDVLIFDNDTLKPGSYAVFTIPKKDAWEIIFYADTNNWGTPRNLEENEGKIIIKTSAKVTRNPDEIKQSFTIGFDDIQANSAILFFSWDRMTASVPFKVATKERVLASIEDVMSGPKADEYYKAADYFLSEKLNMKVALDYINKALDMKKEKPFWYLRKKALIQAELKDYEGAIESAKHSMEGAKAANYESYIISNQALIDEWSKK